MMRYYITGEAGKKLTGNLEGACIDCALRCNKPSFKVKCPVDGKDKRMGKVSDDDVIVFMCDHELVKTSRMFRKQMILLCYFSKELNQLIRLASQDLSKQVFRLLHNLITYNAHILQDIYSIVPQDELSKSGRHVVNAIGAVLKEGDVQNSVSLLRILKNANLMKSEFSIFNL